MLEQIVKGCRVTVRDCGMKSVMLAEVVPQNGEKWMASFYVPMHRALDVEQIVEDALGGHGVFEIRTEQPEKPVLLCRGYTIVSAHASVDAAARKAAALLKEERKAHWLTDEFCIFEASSFCGRYHGFVDGQNSVTAGSPEGVVEMVSAHNAHMPLLSLRIIRGDYVKFIH